MGSYGRISWEKIQRPTLLALFVLIVLGPVAALSLDTVQSVLAGNAQWLTLVVPTGRRLDLFARSLGLAAAVAAGGVVIGILAGSYLWSRKTRDGVYLRRLILLLALIPPYVHALAWSSTAVAFNSLLQAAGLPELLFQGLPAAWWVELMSFLPVGVGLALVGFEAIDPELVDAARIMNDDMRTFREIVLPLAAPAVVGGGIFLFLLSLLDYSVSSLFQVNTYALEIFAEYSANYQPARAFLLAAPLVCVTVLAVIISQAAFRPAALRPAFSRRAWPAELALPAWFKWLQRLGIAVLLLGILVPAVSLTAAVRTWENMTHAVAGARMELGFTFWIAMLTALTCLPLALGVAMELNSGSRKTGWWWLLAILPLAVPAPLIGIGLIAIWNQPVLGGVYGTTAMPVFAGLARFTPLAVIIILAQLRRIDPILIDAARILQSNFWQTLIQVRLWLMLPGFLAAFSMVFALTAGELGATIIVAPPGQVTLTIKIYNFLHYGASSSVAGLCLLMLVAALVAGGVAIRAFKAR